jgi:alanine dehydrogenase
VVTGRGKVGQGAKEILDAIKMKQVDPEHFLIKNYSTPVYSQIDVLDYSVRTDGLPAENYQEFFNHPAKFTSDFERFSHEADIFIAGHFHAAGAPDILTQEMLNHKDNKIKVVADISCDVAGPIACTVRASTIAEPLYGYHASTGTEVDMHHPAAIVVMAVDNLPCELPRDASEGFGQMFLQNVVPAFFNNDKDGILQRALIARGGKLADNFKYLSDYVHENVPHL